MIEATITIEADTTVVGYGIFAAGTYLVWCPSDYDASEIGAVDIVFDSEITIIREVA